MRILTEGLVANNGQPLKAALSWLSGKLVTHKAHKGKPAGTPMSATVIKNYLAGLYVLDIYKADGKLYSQIQSENPRVSISVKATIEVIKPLDTLAKKSCSLEVFNEKLTQICSQYSQIVKGYSKDRFLLYEKHQLSENPKPSQLKKLLMQHCGYSYVGIPGVGYLDLFYRDKIQIDNYLNLLEFIVNNYGDLAQKSLGLVPVAQIRDRIMTQGADYTEEHFKKHLIQLELTHRIELRTTKSQFARNIGIDLVDIRGVKYGFIKILEPAIAV
jgi:hypothetical protein